MMQNFIPVLSVLLCLLWPVPGAAQPQDRSFSDHVKARILAGGLTKDQSRSALLILDLSPGWHTYWRVPGDSGLPPRLTWPEAKNVRHVEISYPPPTRKKEWEFIVFGYEGSVRLPLTITPVTPSRPIQLDLDLQVMVCKEVCIPQALNLSLNIPPDYTPSAGITKRIEQAKAQIPAKEDTPQLKIENAVAGPGGLAVSVFAQQGTDSLSLIPVIGERALTGEPEIIDNPESDRRAVVKIPFPSDIKDPADYMAGKTLNLTLIGPRTAIEKNIEF